MGSPMFRPAVLAALLGALACARSPDVVVVGGGVAGLAAAIEASSDARVTLVECTSRLGGATIGAQGVTAVPDEAFLAEWDARAGSPSVARERYARTVRTGVVAWTEARGVRWGEVPNPAGDGLTLLAPAGGGRALVEGLAGELVENGVIVRLDTRVERLARRGRIEVVLEGGEVISADAVVLATGGFMGDVGETRSRLGLGDVRILRGAPEWADGNGIALGAMLGGRESAGGDAAILYAHGTPSVADPDVALMITDGRSAWTLDATGARVGWLDAARGDSGAAMLASPGAMAWVVFDRPAVDRLRLFDFDRDRVVPLREVARVRGVTADDTDALELRLGLPGGAVSAGLAGPEGPSPSRPLGPGPYAAIEARPTTAKSLLGLDTDDCGRVLESAGNPVPGLFAAGEVSGFGSPYGAAPVDSTMIAGAILTGRVAGRAASRASSSPDCRSLPPR